MKTIDVARGVNFKYTLFPDNQPHVNVRGFINEGDEVEVLCPLKSSLDLIVLLELANALENIKAHKCVLTIPYLMGARFDRIMQPGDSLDLHVIANLINQCGFETVKLFDVHSDAALLLIKNAVNIDNQKLVQQYNQPDSVLICPDAGAAKKIDKYLLWNECFTDIVYCIKKRDLSNGKITLKVLEPEKCTGKRCVIIDDLCDGGGTFNAIASQLDNPFSLTLIVSHGIFSKGFTELRENFDKIITTNSYSSHLDGAGLVETIDIADILC